MRLIPTLWRRRWCALLIIPAIFGATLVTASPASATGTLSASWNPTSPTTSTPVTVTGSISGCGSGNANIPSLYDYITGPNGYSNNNYLGSTTTLSNGGDTASATVSLGTLAAGTYDIQFYGRGTPCFASSSNFTWSTTQTMVVSSGATVPGAPSGVSGSANSNGSVSLSWTAPANNGATITEYTVTPSPSCSGCTGLTVSGSPATAATTITGLTTGTSYTFTVTATNSAGTGSASGASSTILLGALLVTSTALSVSPSTPMAGSQVTFTALVSPAPVGGTVVFTNDGVPIPGCAGQVPDPVTGIAVCTMTYSGGGTHAIAATFSGAGVLDGASTSPAVTIDVGVPTVSDSSPQPIVPTADASVLSMRRITDPYLINEHDLAMLVGCSGTTSCTVTITASVTLGRRAGVVRLPSAPTSVAVGQATIIRLRDTRAMRARIRGYLSRHPRHHLGITIAVAYAGAGLPTVTKTYTVALRTLPGLR